ncbi:hypothetical protein VTO73DRAFT_10529 [Trametes versicolor]
MIYGPGTMKLLAVLLSLATLSLGRSARALSGGSLIPAGAGSLMSGGGGVGSLNPAGGGGAALPLLPAAGGGNSLPLNPASGGGNSLPLGGTSGGGGNPLPLGGSGDNSDLSVSDLLGPGVAALIPAPAPKPYTYDAPSGPSKASSYVPQAQAQHLGADSYQQRYRKRESQTAPADTRPTPEPTGASSASTTVHIIDEHDFALLLPDRPGELISDAESDGVAYCTPDSASPACGKRVAEGFIRAAAVTTSDDGAYIQARSFPLLSRPDRYGRQSLSAGGRYAAPDDATLFLKGASVVVAESAPSSPGPDTLYGVRMVTGCLDASKSSLDPSDTGGQFDVRFPNGAQCAYGGYGASFIQLVEPAANRFCLRCCNKPDDQINCNSHQDRAGCQTAIPGTYAFPSLGVTCEE